MKEMKFLSQLHHQNIVGYLGVTYEGGCTNVFLEYVPGGSIQELLSKFGSFEEVIFIFYFFLLLFFFQELDFFNFSK